MSLVLVTGATGLLGPYLLDAAQRLGRVVGVGQRTGDIRCDLVSADAVAALLAQYRPDVVIHAAGMTDVDGCERAPEQADAVNHLSALHLARALPASARLVTIGTDQVYGQAAGPHREGGEAPVNAYGRSKLAGAVATVGHPNGVALHTNFFGPSRTPGRDSLSDWMTARLRDGQPFSLFTDSLFSPLHAATLAALAVEVAQRGLTGMYNAGSRGGMSKRDFGHAVARHLGLSAAAAEDRLSTTLPGRAPRPLDLRLDVTKIEAALGHKMPSLIEEIAKL